jgi:macrolide transport system ATP-binding/permease protein
MRWRDIFRLRLRSLLRRPAVEQELDEELRYHLDREADENIARGMSPNEGRLAALRTIDGLEQRKEECRDMRGVNVIECCIGDLRFALRQIRKSPGFTATALTMLALGIGASVTIFAFVDAALLKPLPYRDSSRLMRVFETYQHGSRNGLSYLNYVDFEKQNQAFRSMGAFTFTTFRLSSTEGAEAASGFRVSDGFFRTLGVAPALGRDFYDGEDLPGQPRTVLLSYAAWQRRYGGNPGIVGQTVTLNGNANTIVGVLPKQFYFGASNAEFWMALHAGGGCEDRRNCHNMQVVGRLKDGVSRDAALANLAVVEQQLGTQYPATNRGWSSALNPLSETLVEDVRPVLLMLLGCAALLLIIASVNVASLLLVRAGGRKREMAVRTALGASRGRIMGQFVTEGVVLVATGSALGLALASWTMQFLLRTIPAGMIEFMPFLSGLGVNWRVLGFVAIIALLAVVQFAVVPALRLNRAGLAEGSRRSSGNAWRRLGSKMVVAELATAVVLLVGAALLGKSLYRLLQVDLGFQPEHLVTLQMAAPRSYANQDKSIALEQDILNRLEALPGTTSAGIASDLPVLNDWSGGTNIRLLGRPWNGEHNPTVEREVSSSYFTTLGARLRRGRYFTHAEDVLKPAVVVVNEAFAGKYYPGEDPVGKRISYDVGRPLSPVEIIGVVENIKEGKADSLDQATMYVPFVHYAGTYFSLIVRTPIAAQPMVGAMTAAIHQINPEIATKDGGSMVGLISTSGSGYQHRATAWMVGAFAALALLMAVAGLYGVVAYSVSQRTREIGVRLALGATPGTVSGLVLREAGSLALVGIAIGLLGAVGAVSFMRGLLFGVSPWDAPTLVAVSIVLAGSALVASFVPARRAASVNPAEALRAE